MELFKLFGTILVDNDKANKSIHDTTNKADKAKEKIGKSLQTIGKIGVVATTAFATAIGTLTKKAIDNYAEYEQLVGGVETLFKNSSSKILEYAQNAYKTAGISANDYLKTVTSFSASLLQSLGGDTEQASKIADMAIIDMADNANKMGTSMELIQNAYQGFAKANYTMLDNLKLGYGGTKEEMQRLLKDAEKLTGIKYDIKNLDDVYSAIHVIQEEMGITGTTAKEASSTIEGSFSSLKASWENLMTGFADPNQDLGLLMENVSDTAVIAFMNLGERIKETVPRILGAFADLGKKMLVQVGKLGDLIVSDSPTFTKKIGVFIQNAVSYVSSNMPTWIQNIFGLLTNVISSNLPSIVQEGILIIKSLANGIYTNMPILIDNGMNAILSFIQGIMAQLPFLIQEVPKIVIVIANTISSAIPQLLMKGAEIIWAIITGLIGAIPDLIANFPLVIEAIIAVWNAINWWNLGKTLIMGIWNGITSLFATFQTNISGSFNGISGTIKGIFNGLKETVIGIWKSLVDNISNVINFFKGLATSAFNALVSTVVNIFVGLSGGVKNIWDNIKNAISSAVQGASNFVSSAVNGIKTTVSNVFNGIKTTASNVWNGIKTAITTPIEGAKNIVKGVIDTMKGFFNFKWELPKIKLPHFSVKGSANPIDWLTQGIPKISVEWYKKGAILEKPTMFGFNPYTNSAMVGGEAGKEAVAPISELMKYVRMAVNESNNAMYEQQKNIILLMTEYFPQFANMKVVLNNGVLVGELIDDIDDGLGDKKRRKGR